MTVRKIFIFDSEIAKQIEEIAKLDGKRQTQVLQEPRVEHYKEILIQKKLALFDEINDSFHGLLTEVDAKALRIEDAMDMSVLKT